MEGSKFISINGLGGDEKREKIADILNRPDLTLEMMTPEILEAMIDAAVDDLRRSRSIGIRKILPSNEKNNLEDARLARKPMIETIVESIMESGANNHAEGEVAWEITERVDKIIEEKERKANSI